MKMRLGLGLVLGLSLLAFFGFTTFVGPLSTNPAPFAYNPAGQPSAADEAAVVAGAHLWEGVGAHFKWNYLGVAPDGISVCHSQLDGINVVGWDQSLFPVGTNAIAVTCRIGDEFDVAFNPSFHFATTGNAADGIDVETIAGHELGHGLGMGHSQFNTAIMWFAYHGPMRALAPDDVAGVCFLYGGCPAGTPGPTATPAPTVTTTGTPKPPTASPPPVTPKKSIPPLPRPRFQKGDMNCDGQVDSVDALLILRAVADLDTNLPPGCPDIRSRPRELAPEDQAFAGDPILDKKAELEAVGITVDILWPGQ